MKNVFLGLILLISIGQELLAATQEEIDALTAIYNSTSGENWTDKENWLEGDPCTDSWYGIICVGGKCYHSRSV